MSLYRLGVIVPTPEMVSLNGPLDSSSYIVKWTTPSLLLTDLNGQPIVGAATGPLTFWAVGERLPNGNATLGPLDQSLFPAVVQSMAALAERAALDKLVNTIRLGAIIDPGRTNLLVTGPGRLQTGVLPSGQVVNQIPNSVVRPGIQTSA